MCQHLAARAEGRCEGAIGAWIAEYVTAAGAAHMSWRGRCGRGTIRSSTI